MAYALRTEADDECLSVGRTLVSRWRELSSSGASDDNPAAWQQLEQDLQLLEYWVAGKTFFELLPTEHTASLTDAELHLQNAYGHVRHMQHCEEPTDVQEMLVDHTQSLVQELADAVDELGAGLRELTLLEADQLVGRGAGDEHRILDRRSGIQETLDEIASLASLVAEDRARFDTAARLEL